MILKLKEPNMLFVKGFCSRGVSFDAKRDALTFWPTEMCSLLTKSTVLPNNTFFCDLTFRKSL